ncbi:Altered inheritance of mitochondria protein 19-like protein [Smittium culicis]|uniref:Altered inheritance of mitochondria protein 19-like protein n=1 Tax=Smittium culicis TaxID=133412 RepID=A0A1R1Y806_9FUNG|nr:Altered inheritance of mitochondria protein 19-like protein [Smittium culicis]
MTDSNSDTAKTNNLARNDVVAAPQTATSSSSNSKWDTVLKRLDSASTSPYPSIFLSAIHIASIPFSLGGKYPGFPSFLQCAGFAFVFAGGSMALKDDQKLNGTGIITAWSMTWLFFNARKSLKSRRFGPTLLFASVSSIGTLYSQKYIRMQME